MCQKAGHERIITLHKTGLEFYGLADLPRTGMRRENGDWQTGPGLGLELGLGRSNRMASPSPTPKLERTPC